MQDELISDNEELVVGNYSTPAVKRIVILSLLRKCNLRCVYCRGKSHDWYDQLGQRARLEVFPRGYWTDFKEYCLAHKVGEVLMTGGEPSLYPHLREFITFLHKEKLRIALHTNGTTSSLLAIPEYLKAHGIPIDFVVSSELFDLEQHELRGTSLPVPFIRLAAQHGFRVVLKVILHQRILQYLGRIPKQLAWWIQQGVSSIRFQPVAPYGDQKSDELLLKSSFIPVLKMLQEIKESDPCLGPSLLNSTSSLEIIEAIIERSPACFNFANSCNVVNEIAFVTTQLEFLNCKSLWSKSEDRDCSDAFDFVCAGFQR